MIRLFSFTYSRHCPWSRHSIWRSNSSRSAKIAAPCTRRWIHQCGWWAWYGPGAGADVQRINLWRAKASETQAGSGVNDSQAVVVYKSSQACPASSWRITQTWRDTHLTGIGRSPVLPFPKIWATTNQTRDTCEDCKCGNTDRQPDLNQCALPRIPHAKAAESQGMHEIAWAHAR